MRILNSFSRFESKLIQGWASRTDAYKHASGHFENRETVFLATYGSDGPTRARLIRSLQFTNPDRFDYSGDFYFDVGRLLIWADAGKDIEEFTRNMATTGVSISDFQYRKLRHISGLVTDAEKTVTVKRFFRKKGFRFVPRYPILFNGKATYSNRIGFARSYSPELVCIQNAQVFGTGIVLSNGQLWIGDPAADPVEDFVSGLWNRVSGHKLKSDTATLLIEPSEKIQTITEAVQGIGRVPSNYWHLIIEYIPAIAKAITQSGCKTVLWSSQSPESALTALELLYPDLKIIKVGPGQHVEVEKLHQMSFSHATWDSPLRAPLESCGFTAMPIKALYSPLTRNSRRQSSQFYGAKVLLTRGSSLRLVTGLDEFIDHSRHLGFIILDPTKLSLQEQCEIFQNAEIVASFGGAVWANLVFAHPKLKTLNFISQSMSWYLGHRHIAKTLGVRMITVAMDNDPVAPQYTSFSDEIHTGLVADQKYLDLGLSKLRSLDKSLPQKGLS